MPKQTSDVVEVFEKVADLLEIEGENRFNGSSPFSPLVPETCAERTSTLGYGSNCSRPILSNSSGGIPSREKKPCTPEEGALRGSRVSILFISFPATAPVRCSVGRLHL